MNCKFHPEAKAVTKCAKCGADLCSACDTNAICRTNKGALCLNCSQEIRSNVVTRETGDLKKLKRKLIFATIFIVLAIVNLILAFTDGGSFWAFAVLFWFLSGLIQTWGAEKEYGSLKSMVTQDTDNADDFSLVKFSFKVIYYVFAAPIMLILNFKEYFERKVSLKVDIQECEEINAALNESNKQSFEYWEKKAEKGDADAQVTLATLYAEGKGVAQNYAKAIELLTEPAEKGNAWGQVNLGTCYILGEGVEQNYEKAVDLFKKSVKQGNPVAQFYLGLCYYEGTGVEKDYAKAVELWEKAVGQGESRAFINLGLCYQEGKGVVQDHDRAVELWQIAAECGNEDAKQYLQQYA